MPATRHSLLHRLCNDGGSSDWRAFDVLYRPLLIEYATRRGLQLNEAEEIAQECLATLAIDPERVSRGRRFRSWLRGMVNNKVADSFRARKGVRRADTACLANIEDHVDPDDDWDRTWNRAHLLFCLRKLRSEFADHTMQAFYLYVFEELAVSEIRDRLGMTSNQVYVAKSRVIRRLRQEFERTLEELYGDSE